MQLLHQVGDGESGSNKLLELTSGIAIAYLMKNQVDSPDVSELLRGIHKTLVLLRDATDKNGPSAARDALRSDLSPAFSGTNSGTVEPQNSIQPDYLICLEDGSRLKMLKRYLKRKYGMSPEEYRKKWNLPDDYPMVAPNYTVKRSQIAKKFKLGHKRQRRKQR